MAPNGRQSPGHELQTPGAGSSHKPSQSLEIPVPQQARLATGAAIVRSRTPTRTSTLHEDIEFGVYLRSAAEDVEGDSLSQSSRGGIPAGEQDSSESVPEPTRELDPHKSFFLANPAWKTDIITFCSHARVDPILGTAHITHIQARKSNRPPFLHEYLLVFFTALDNHRFVMRIDRLGKVKSTTSDNFRKGRRTAANAAVQGVGVYHIADSQIDVDSVDGPWLASDGGWGSRPVATLATWESLRTSGTHVSHHITANETSSLHQPKLQDVSRLLEAILLEMPNYHLTTANCYFMTRSSLLLLQRCYPSAFACFLGTTAHQMIPASTLAQPIWAGLLRWYLPFVTLFFLAYVIVLTIAYQQILYIAGCLDYRYIFPNNACHLSRLALAALYALHAILDAPLPIGVMHAYMTSLEVEMNKLVENLSARFADSRGGRNGAASPRPFGVLFEAAWLTALAWCVLGGVGALFVFVSMAFEYGALMVFVLSLVACIVFNLKLGTSRSGPLPDEQEVDDIFGPIPEI